MTAKFLKFKRFFLFNWQKLTCGFSDADLWSLDMTIAKFVYPRLKAFARGHAGYPGNLTDEKWQEYLDDMVFAMEIMRRDVFVEPEDEERFNKGLKLFGEYFDHLWS